MGMQLLHGPNEAVVEIIEGIREALHHPRFVQRHRKWPQAFTRQRCLNFEDLMLLLLQKTLKAVQLHLHEYFARLARTVPWRPVSTSAWTQARTKLSHGAFIELNQAVVLQRAYAPEGTLAARRWRGHRLLALDSSLVRLPAEVKIAEVFGWVECSNQQGELDCRYPQARLSVVYDVLNRLALDARLGDWKQGERAVGITQLAATGGDDVMVTDRGYASYEWFAQVLGRQRHFICRCARATFAVAEQLFEGDEAGRSVTVSVGPPNGQVGAVRSAGLPEQLTVRWITVRLSSGELEVLATSLLDEQRYPSACFEQAYGYRWGEETFYGLLKGRLDLENFSGRSVESVQQDVHATILLSNLESVVTRSAQARMDQGSKRGRQPVQVNRAVSFHVLKSHLIELLASKLPTLEVLNRLEELFLHNPVLVRAGRKRPRRKRSAWRSYHYQRTRRKIVF